MRVLLPFVDEIQCFIFDSLSAVNFYRKKMPQCVAVYYLLVATVWNKEMPHRGLRKKGKV